MISFTVKFVPVLKSNLWKRFMGGAPEVGGFLGTILWQSQLEKYCPAEASYTELQYQNVHYMYRNTYKNIYTNIYNIFTRILAYKGQLHGFAISKLPLLHTDQRTVLA